MTADTRATAIVCAVVILLALVFVAIPAVAFAADGSGELSTLGESIIIGMTLCACGLAMVQIESPRVHRFMLGFGFGLLVFIAVWVLLLQPAATAAPHPCAGATYHATVDKGTGWRVCALVHDTARKAKVSPSLAVAVAQVESHFRPAAISHAGAVGPMQVKPRYHCPRGMRAFWRCRLTDTVRAGVGYLRELTERHGIDGGLARYNCGPSNYARNAAAAAACDDYARRVRGRVR